MENKKIDIRQADINAIRLLRSAYEASFSVTADEQNPMKDHFDAHCFDSKVLFSEIGEVLDLFPQDGFNFDLLYQMADCYSQKNPERATNALRCYHIISKLISAIIFKRDLVGHLSILFENIDTYLDSFNSAGEFNAKLIFP